MKTDRELLELAAKAAGFEGVVTEYENGYVEMALTNHIKPNGGNVWNPLRDDGDVFRLAVELGINTYDNKRSGHMESIFYDETNDETRSIFEPYDKDTGTEAKLAPARRAIVRAAAAIQSAKEQKT